MGSTRLPGKVLMPLGDATMLAQVVARAQRARLNGVVVATTLDAADDAIVDACGVLGVPVFRGDEHDVLSRYYLAAVEHHADAVVRVTSDCPLLDPEVIDAHIERLMGRWNEVDFVTNMVQQSYPLGLAVEAMPMDVLARMHRLSTTPYLREHVTTLAYEQPDLFLIDHVLHPTDLLHLRWTVDTMRDMEFARAVFDHFGHNHFTWHDILRFVELHPELSNVNQLAGATAGPPPKSSPEAGGGLEGRMK
jgi:spore coat polysaccharide biosynthesis protein SpsF